MSDHLYTCALVDQIQCLMSWQGVKSGLMWIEKACMATLIGAILVCIQCCTVVTLNLDGTLASVTVQYMSKHFMFGLRWYIVCMHVEYTDHTI